MSAYRRRAAVAIPGLHNRLAAAFSKVAPQAITRKVAAAVIRRAE